MFRRRRGRHRRRNVHVYDASEHSEAEAGEGAAEPPGAEGGAGPRGPDDQAVRGDGPWDVGDPAPDADRVDFGALHIPDLPGYRIEATFVGEQVVGATIVEGPNALQVQALAAPKTGRIWDEVRRDLMRDLRANGGEAVEVDGRFGAEVQARVPVDTEARQRVLLPARMVGVEGPRWLLRGTFAGPAAHDPDAAERLEDVFREIVVVRGDAPIPPREPLELRLPPQDPGRPGGGPDSGGGGADLGPGAGGDPFDPYRRGPEITETR